MFAGFGIDECCFGGLVSAENISVGLFRLFFFGGVCFGGFVFDVKLLGNSPIGCGNARLLGRVGFMLMIFSSKF